MASVMAGDGTLAHLDAIPLKTSVTEDDTTRLKEHSPPLKSSVAELKGDKTRLKGGMTELQGSVTEGRGEGGGGNVTQEKHRSLARLAQASLT